MKKPGKLNLPNVLSAYRIIALPFICYTIYVGNKNLYITLLSINLVTDILDGWIARSFNLQTEFGARLDSLADIGTYLMAFCGMIILEPDFVREKYLEFSVLIALYFAGVVLCLFKFGRTPSLHLYSSKITGYLQGIFIFSYFVWGYNGLYFYFMLFISYIAYLEEIVILATIPELRSNVKGIWFMVKQSGGIR